jgi:hypothetical protein
MRRLPTASAIEAPVIQALPTKAWPPSVQAKPHLLRATHGTVPDFWNSFSAARRRIQEGGWARQVNVTDFPISKEIAIFDPVGIPSPACTILFTRAALCATAPHGSSSLSKQTRRACPVFRSNNTSPAKPKMIRLKASSAIFRPYVVDCGPAPPSVWRQHRPAFMSDQKVMHVVRMLLLNP